eukprot:scaffold253528_cov31-Tisochrysis_lutea.AAC.1
MKRNLGRGQPVALISTLSLASMPNAKTWAKHQQRRSRYDTSSPPTEHRASVSAITCIIALPAFSRNIRITGTGPSNAPIVAVTSFVPFFDGTNAAALCMLSRTPGAKASANSRG